MNDYYFSVPKNVTFVAIRDLVFQCENEVFFESTEGDRIALKSTLGQFIFFSMEHESDLLYTSSCIHCIGERDRDILSAALDLIKK